MNMVVLNEEKFKLDADRVVELSRQLQNSRKDYLDNVLELLRVGNRLVGEVWNTQFHVFGAISSDTDHLPTKEVRRLCSQAMLEKTDKELESVIKFYKDDVSTACCEIISKYENV